MKKTFLSVVISAALAVTASAQLLVNETFDTSGTLTGQTPTIGGTWTTHSGTSGQISVSNGQIMIDETGTLSEDLNTSFTQFSSGSLFFSFDFNVANQGTPVTGGDYEYFAHFLGSDFSYPSRVDIVAPNSSGDFSVGISSTSAAEATWGTDLAFDTTYKVVVRFDFTTGISTLWIDPTAASDISILSAVSSATDISAFAFRQSKASSPSSVGIDNLKVGTSFDLVTSAVPEPSSYAAILGAMGLAFVGYRRRK